MLQFNYPTPIPLGDGTLAKPAAIPFALTNLDGSPYDYTGCVLKLFIGETPFDAGGTYALTKSTADVGISAVSPTGGTGNINFFSTDAALLSGKTYYYGFRDETNQVTLSAGTMPFADHPGR